MKERVEVKSNKEAANNLFIKVTIYQRKIIFI